MPKLQGDGPGGGYLVYGDDGKLNHVPASYVLNDPDLAGQALMAAIQGHRNQVDSPRPMDSGGEIASNAPSAPVAAPEAQTNTSVAPTPPIGAPAGSQGPSEPTDNETPGGNILAPAQTAPLTQTYQPPAAPPPPPGAARAAGRVIADALGVKSPLAREAAAKTTEGISRGNQTTILGAQGQSDVEENEDLQQKQAAADQLAKQDLAQQAQKLQALQSEVMNTKIDPRHFYESQSVPQKILSIIGLAAGGFFSGRTGQANPAAQMITEQVKNDVDAQVNNLANKRAGVQAQESLYGRNLAILQDDRAARAATMAQLLTREKARIDALKMQTDAPIVQAELDAQSAGIQNEIITQHSTLATQAASRAQSYASAKLTTSQAANEEAQTALAARQAKALQDLATGGGNSTQDTLRRTIQLLKPEDKARVITDGTTGNLVGLATDAPSAEIAKSAEAHFGGIRSNIKTMRDTLTAIQNQPFPPSAEQIKAYNGARSDIKTALSAGVGKEGDKVRLSPVGEKELETQLPQELGGLPYLSPHPQLGMRVADLKLLEQRTLDKQNATRKAYDLDPIFQPSDKYGKPAVKPNG